MQAPAFGSQDSLAPKLNFTIRTLAAFFLLQQRPPDCIDHRIKSDRLNLQKSAIMIQGILALLLQASLFVLTEASPIKAQIQNNQQFGIGGGIVGFIVLVLDIIVWSECLRITKT